MGGEKVRKPLIGFDLSFIGPEKESEFPEVIQRI